MLNTVERERGCSSSQLNILTYFYQIVGASSGGAVDTAIYFIFDNNYQSANNEAKILFISVARKTIYSCEFAALFGN